jgi:hypothetical protein
VCVCVAYLYLGRVKVKEKLILLCVLCVDLISGVKGRSQGVFTQRASCRICAKSFMQKFQKEGAHCVWINIVLVNSTFSILTNKVMYK